MDAKLETLRKQNKIMYLALIELARNDNWYEDDHETCWAHNSVTAKEVAQKALQEVEAVNSRKYSALKAK